MDTNVNYEIFQCTEEARLREIPNLTGMDEERFKLFSDMIRGEYCYSSYLDISKFLRPDLSINLELLEIAISLLVEFLTVYLDYDTPISIGIRGIDKYYELRGIIDNEKQKKEEYYFIRGFIKSFAQTETNRKVNVEYAKEEKLSDL